MDSNIPTPGRGPGLCLADFKGCGTMFSWIAAAIIFAGWIKQRSDARAIHGLQNLIEEVHTNLKKGKVMQAIDLLEVFEAEAAQQN